MATRAIWKGAISFGLVHVPVALHPAASEGGVDFDWLDQRTMDPVGYKRINKRTGKEIAREHIVKGVKLDDGDYVVLGDDEVKAAYPRSTQTIEIETFVAAAEIPFVFLERPYYLEPVAKGQKVYALLREAMLEQGVIGIARVVIHTKEHLAALVPSGAALVLVTLRWATEIRALDELELPGVGRSAANLKVAELKMAAKLVADMTGIWQPQRYADKFAQAVMELVRRRAQAGRTEKVEALEPDTQPRAASNVVDLTDLLKRSLGQRRPETRGGKQAAANAGTKDVRQPPAKRTGAKPESKPAAGKTAARKRA